MNTERLLHLAQMLDTDPRVQSHFDMRDFFSDPKHGGDYHNLRCWIPAKAEALNDCQTCACIAGWTILEFHGDLPTATERPAVFQMAAALLDLKKELANDLMADYPDTANPVTPQQAAAVIRNLVATGEVDWFCKGGVPCELS